MREGYCVEVEERGDGTWIADWESYTEVEREVPKYSGSTIGSSPSDALRNVATAIYDLRSTFHD